MKIVVIGATARIRLETAERLRESGYEVMPVPPRRRPVLHAAVPTDPGHAGRHLRHLLAGAAACLHGLWGRLRPRDGDTRQRRG